jgi:hypothetical protein
MPGQWRQVARLAYHTTWAMPGERGYRSTVEEQIESAYEQDKHDVLSGRTMVELLRNHIRHT